MEKIKSNSSKKNKSLGVYIPLALVILIVIIGSIWWYKEYSKYISTDDAHVDSDKVSVSSKIIGRISHLYADEGDAVKQGTLIAELDSSDLVAQKLQAIALQAQAEATLNQSDAKFKYDQESLKTLEINLEKTNEDFTRAKEQLAGDVIPKEQYDHAKKAYQSAKAQYDAAKTQLNVSKAQIAGAESSIGSAKAQINVISTQLNNTRLYAPIDGIVAKRWLLPGDITQPGQSIMTITNDNKLWVTVYLEETNLGKIHLNQKVLFTIDAFSDVTFTGKIYSIGSNTASQFSLIPPNNASGNFTKVTQRVPIKVSIDGAGNKNISNYKLLAGMSAVVKIVKD